MRRGTGPPLCLDREDQLALQAVLGLGLTAWVEEQVVGLPCSFHGWRVEGLVSDRGGVSGLVTVVELGTLRTPPPLFGYMDILIDDYDCVASPFGGGTELEQAAAFGWLVLVALLLHGSASPEMPETRSSAPAGWRTRCGSAEYGLLRRIGRHEGLRLLPSASFFSFYGLQRWLWRRASLLAAGHRLRLCTRWYLAPARKLAVTLEWMAARLPLPTLGTQASPSSLSLVTPEVCLATSHGQLLALAGCGISCLTSLARSRLPPWLLLAPCAWPVSWSAACPCWLRP